MDTISLPTILFVGSNPSVKSGRVTAFWQDTKSSVILGRWVRQVPGIEKLRCYCINVSNLPTEGNRPLKAQEIRDSLGRLHTDILLYDPVKIVTLGKTAEKALTLLQLPHFAMPHPSGLNRQLNDPAFVQEKIKKLQEYCSYL
jgi:uracil-DNA glycosylase